MDVTPAKTNMINMHSNQPQHVLLSCVCLERVMSTITTSNNILMPISTVRATREQCTLIRERSSASLLLVYCVCVDACGELSLARLQARAPAPHGSCNCKLATKYLLSRSHCGGKPQKAWQQLLFLQPCGCRKPAKSYESFPNVNRRDVAHTTAEDQGCVPVVTTIGNTAPSGHPTLDTFLSGNHRHLPQLLPDHQALQMIFCQAAQALTLPPRHQLKP